MVTIIHRFKLKYVFKPGLAIVQVNLCQKLLFLHHLTNIMTTDCSFFMKILSSEYLQNMLCTQIVVFVLTFRTIFVHNMFFRCCELLKKFYLCLKVVKSQRVFSISSDLYHYEPNYWLPKYIAQTKNFREPNFVQ